jgi:hypothetical protein
MEVCVRRPRLRDAGALARWCLARVLPYRRGRRGHSLTPALPAYVPINPWPEFHASPADVRAERERATVQATAKGMVRWRRDVLLACASVFFMSAAALAWTPDPIQIIKRGAQTLVSFISHNSFLRAELWYFGNTPPGPGQPLLSNGFFLFATDGTNSVLNGALPVGPGFDLSGILGGGYPEGTPLYFALFVQDEFPNATGDARNAWFFTGGAAQNPDSTVHALVAVDSAGNYIISFEDLCRQDARWCNGPAFSDDFDYNDVVFRVYTTPEPGSLALLGTGLFGLAALLRGRRLKARTRERPGGREAR